MQRLLDAIHRRFVEERAYGWTHPKTRQVFHGIGTKAAEAQWREQVDRIKGSIQHDVNIREKYAEFFGRRSVNPLRPHR